MTQPKDSQSGRATRATSADLLDAREVSEKFKRYRELESARDGIRRRRGDSFGIAVGTDPEAIEWQGYSREVEEIEAFLESRQPIPERWGEPSSNDQAEARRQ